MRKCGIAKAPEGWWCSRELGHSGPCAARHVTAGYLRDRREERELQRDSDDAYEPMPPNLRILNRRSELADAANDAERREWLTHQRALRRQTLTATTGCASLVILALLAWAALALWLAASGILRYLHFMS